MKFVHFDRTDSFKSNFKPGPSRSELSHDVSYSMPQSAFVKWDFMNDGLLISYNHQICIVSYYGQVMMYFDSFLYCVYYASIVCTMYLLLVLCIICCLYLMLDYLLRRCRTTG
jgi:hypothetical protein